MRKNMHLRKSSGQWRGLKVERSSSEVGGNNVSLFLMPIHVRGAAYSISGGGGGQKGSWHNYLGSKLNRR